MAFVFKSIIPSDMDTDVFRLEYLNELRKEGRTIKRQYQKTTRTWKKKPKFEILIGLSRIAGDASVLVGTDNDIYRFLDEGTRVRHAVMTPDFRGKTAPKVIASRRGRGGKVFVSRKIRMPGIKARKFSETIADKRTKPFERNMNRANKRAADKVFK